MLIRSFGSLFSYIVLALITAGFLLSAAVAEAADLRLSPASGSYTSGQTIQVTVQVDPTGQTINAVEGTVTFDTANLSLVSVSKAGSALTLWTEDPTTNPSTVSAANSAGSVTFGGGNPSPFSSISNLLLLTFRVTGEGSANVGFSEATILQADQFATDVTGDLNGATYTLSGAPEPTPTPEPEPEPTPAAEPESTDAAIAFGDPPRAPEVGSTAFLDPDVWYSITDGIFTWELPFDVSAVAVEIATSSDNEPSEVFDPPIEEFVVSSDNVQDGIQYLSIQFENQVGWGAVTNRQIKIDTTPPEAFDINVRAGTQADSFPTITFAATDETSGIDYYELIVADREPIEVTPGEAGIGYLLTELEDGTYTVTVTAYDMAGNKTVSTAPVLITAGWTPPLEVVEESSLWDFFTGKNLIIMLLVVASLLQFGYILYERRRFSEKETLLRKETKEIQDQMEKIFSALRDEIYDQINTITKRPRLSKKEKEAVEGLNQALEVSETLIEKEINDVKKVLK